MFFKNKFTKIESEIQNLTKYTEYLTSNINASIKGNNEIENILKNIENLPDSRPLKEKGLIISIYINVSGLSIQQSETVIANVIEDFQPTIESLKQYMAFVENFYIPLNDNSSSSKSSIDIKII